MERIVSDEEKLRRAIEISQRRNNINYRTVATPQVNINEKKDYKLFKKMILQIIICLLIYMIFYLITTTNYVFSSDVIENTKNILNYDMDFTQIYNNLMLIVNSKTNTNQESQEDNMMLNNTNQKDETITQNNVTENIITSEDDNLVETEKNEIQDDSKKDVESTENKIEENAETKVEETAKSQMELDAEEVAKLCQFQKPLSGTITSEFGGRESTIEGMTTDHKGIDIAANSGTSIKAAMAGTVSVAEENSEYGKFIKIVNGDVMTVYAHCKKLKVKVGDKIKMGQIIATVGSTGVSTGPHLHFEIRFENRYINPRYLIQF